MLFRTFVGFCVVICLPLNKIAVVHVLSYLEYLARNQVSYHMIANHVSAAKAQFRIRGLDYSVWSHENVKYFLKSLKLHRPLKVIKRNIMDVKILSKLICLCDLLYMGKIFKVVFLVGFFGFLCLFNIAPHSYAAFNPSRHLTAGDLIFTKHYMKIMLKSSKTNQFWDICTYVNLSSHPGFKPVPLCSM